jgi:hypothetical protein
MDVKNIDGVVYGKFSLVLPVDAMESNGFNTLVDGYSANTVGNPKYGLMGKYTFSPQAINMRLLAEADNLTLRFPATISVTYNDQAINNYKKINPSFSENNLVLAFEDGLISKYFPIPGSTLDKKNKKITAKVWKIYGGLYSGGIVLIEKKNALKEAQLLPIDIPRFSSKYAKNYSGVCAEQKSSQGDLVSSNKILIDRCYYKYAIGLKDFAVCDKISQVEYAIGDRASRELCQSYIAALNNNLDKCNSIGSEFPRTNCLTWIAQIRSDSKVCEKITETAVVSRDKCFSIIANQKHDKNICNKISSDSSKSFCLKTIK